MSSKKRVGRAKIIIMYFAFFSIGILLLLKFFHSNIIYFVTPKELQTYDIRNLQQTFKLGGYVKEGSLIKLAQGEIKFTVTDFEENTEVTYKGVVPDLFKEGQGTIATGFLNDEGIFIASEILAKHDENYIPKEVVDSVKNIGQWRN